MIYINPTITDRYYFNILNERDDKFYKSSRRNETPIVFQGKNISTRDNLVKYTKRLVQILI